MQAEYIIQERVNNCLDSTRRARGLRTDAELAVAIGISPKQLSQWRNGILPRGGVILIRLLLDCMKQTGIQT